MSGKLNITVVLFLVLFICTGFLNSEIIRESVLAQKKKPFQIKRDLFVFGPLKKSIRPGRKVKPGPVKSPAAVKPAEESVEARLRRSLSYEGYIVKNKEYIALINVEGEYEFLKKREKVFDMFLVLSIDSEKIRLKKDSEIVEILLKGVPDDK